MPFSKQNCKQKTLINFTMMLIDSVDSMGEGTFVFFCKMHIWQVLCSRFLMLHSHSYRKLDKPERLNHVIFQQMLKISSFQLWSSALKNQLLITSQALTLWIGWKNLCIWYCRQPSWYMYIALACKCIKICFIWADIVVVPIHGVAQSELGALHCTTCS